MPVSLMLLQMILGQMPNRSQQFSHTYVCGSPDVNRLHLASRIVLMMPVRRALATRLFECKHGAMGALVSVILATVDGWMVRAESIRRWLTWAYN
jgi:hypothetical protein